jgi:phage shock protein A
MLGPDAEADEGERDRMSFWSRLKMIFGAKANRALDRAEKPGEMLDYSYERQLELLEDMRRGIADVATARKRIEMQAQQLQATSQRLEAQARQALAAGRDDLAREALARRISIRQEIEDLKAQHEALQAQETKLVERTRATEERIHRFRTQKETMKAQYSASEAQARVGEAYAGVGDDMKEVGLAMQRAEDKIAQAQARAAAMDELMASGALEDSSGGQDRIQAELDRVGSQGEVEAELARLRAELQGSAGSPPLEPQSQVTVDPSHSSATPPAPGPAPVPKDAEPTA